MLLVVILLSCTPLLVQGQCGRPSWPDGAKVITEINTSYATYDPNTTIAVACNGGSMFEVTYELFCDRDEWSVTSTPPGTSFKSCGERIG